MKINIIFLQRVLCEFWNFKSRKVLDKHSKWHGTDWISNDDIIYIMDVSISTFQKARMPLEEN